MIPADLAAGLPLEYRGRVVGGCMQGRALIVLLPTLVLLACAVAPTAEQLEISQQAEPWLESPKVLSIVDERAPAERSTHDLGIVFMAPAGTLGSVQPTTGAIGCDGGVSVLGEEVGNGSPDRLARLERDMIAAFGPEIKGETLVIRRYAIYSNAEAVIATQNKEAYKNNAKKGVSIEPKCQRAQMKGGWFDPADLENNYSPITVEIAVVFRGAEYSATAAQSPPIFQYWNQWVLPVVSQAAMKKANARLIEAIKRH